MKKVVVVVKNGMYLSGFKSDETMLKVSFDYHDDFRQALSIPFRSYDRYDVARESIDEIARFAEGEVAVMTMHEDIETLDGEQVDMEALRDLYEEENGDDDKSDFIDFMRSMLLD